MYLARIGNKLTYYIVGIFSTSLLLLLIPLRLYAAPLGPSASKLVTRCEGPAKTSSSEAQRGDNCTSVWAEELEKEYQDRDAEDWWKRFYLGPQDMSEQELHFLYRPGERRPLWGY